MRHLCWPRYAYAGITSPKKYTRYETRWHGRGASFGVRRPLRYLAHRLDLDESQTRRMAAVLNQLKTEREQAAVDEKRSIAAIAELMAEGTPTLEEVHEALESRANATHKLNEETAKAVVAISDFLDEDQKDEFINLLLTGTISL